MKTPGRPAFVAAVIFVLALVIERLFPARALPPVRGWLLKGIGYLVQRPEMHSVHHARGVHAYNYGNLALWDLVFGTYRNPRELVAQAGFWDGASHKLVPMLLGRDVA